VENAYTESYNSRLRDACPTVHMFFCIRIPEVMRRAGTCLRSPRIPIQNPTNNERNVHADAQLSGRPFPGSLVLAGVAACLFSAAAARADVTVTADPLDLTGGFMNVSNLFNQTTDAYGGQILTFTGLVLANTLPPGTFSVDLAIDPAAGRHVQYGFQMIGENVWITDVAPFGTVQMTAIPGPSTLVLNGLGLFLLVRGIRRRGKGWFSVTKNRARTRQCPGQAGSFCRKQGRSDETKLMFDGLIHNALGCVL